MHIKIFFNDKTLFLCDKIDETIEPYVHHDDAIMMDELDVHGHAIKTMIHEMAQEKVQAGVFVHSDLKELKNAFFKKFKLIKAGGGLIENEKGEVLMIFRRGKWDLPKGKLDNGETIEECALREVQEETGLNEVVLGPPLMITYHIYHEGTKNILKESHWYAMQASSDKNLTPQTEEDILDIKWVAAKDIEPYLANSFPSIVDLLKAWLLK